MTEKQSEAQMREAFQEALDTCLDGVPPQAEAWFKAGWQAALRTPEAQRAGRGDGWRLVPVEPTPAMVLAMNAAYWKLENRARESNGDCILVDEYAVTIYRAMLAAAPTPAQPAAEPVAWRHQLVVDGQVTLDVCDETNVPCFGIPGVDHGGKETITPLYTHPAAPDASAGTVNAPDLAALKGRLAAISIYDVPESMKPLHKLAADSIACVERILMAIDGRIPMGDLAPLMFPEFHPVEVLTAEMARSMLIDARTFLFYTPGGTDAWRDRRDELIATIDAALASGATVCRPAGGDGAVADTGQRVWSICLNADEAELFQQFLASTKNRTGCIDMRDGENRVSLRCVVTDPIESAAPASPAEPEGREGLTFDAFRKANAARCVKWHPAGIASWSDSDWIVAIVGELGELASLIKMRNRERDGLPGNKFSPTDEQIAKEAADVYTYLDLFCERNGINLGLAAAQKFNEVSERVGFPDRINPPGFEDHLKTELPYLPPAAEKARDAEPECRCGRGMIYRHCPVHGDAPL